MDLGTNCQLNNLEAWDAGNELVKAGYKGPKGETATTINDELRKCKDTIDMVFQYYEVNDKIPTPSEVQKAFKELCQLAEINEPVRITTYKGHGRQDAARQRGCLPGFHPRQCGGEW